MPTPRVALAISQLIIYTPAFFLASFLSLRSKFRQLQYPYLATLATIRIIGSVLSIKASQSSDTSFITTAAILNGVGLSPLVLAILGFVIQLCSIVGMKRTVHHLNYLHFPIMIALPLLIIGVLKLFSSGSPSQHTLGKILAAIGLAHFFLTFSIQSLFSILATTKLTLNAGSRREKVLFGVVNSMIPLILLRLLYSSLAFFVTSTRTFSPNTGGLAAQVAMSVLPENLVAVMGLSLGFLVITSREEEIASEGIHHRLKSLPRGGRDERENVGIEDGDRV